MASNVNDKFRSNAGRQIGEKDFALVARELGYLASQLNRDETTTIPLALILSAANKAEINTHFSFLNIHCFRMARNQILRFV